MSARVLILVVAGVLSLLVIGLYAIYAGNAAMVESDRRLELYNRCQSDRDALLGRGSHRHCWLHGAPGQTLEWVDTENGFFLKNGIGSGSDVFGHIDYDCTSVAPSP